MRAFRAAASNPKSTKTIDARGLDNMMEYIVLMLEYKWLEELPVTKMWSTSWKEASCTSPNSISGGKRASLFPKSTYRMDLSETSLLNGMGYAMEG